MIRKATPEDLPVILEIIKEVKRLMLEGGNPQWNSDYPGEREYSRDIELGELWLEEAEGVITGFMTVNDNLSKEYDDVIWTTELPANSIHRLAVNPLCRGKGVARRLFAFAEDLSKRQGMKSIRLDTFSPNKTAQRLFANNGYTYVGEIFMKGRKVPYLCFEKALMD